MNEGGGASERPAEIRVRVVASRELRRLLRARFGARALGLERTHLLVEEQGACTILVAGDVGETEQRRAQLRGQLEVAVRRQVAVLGTSGLRSRVDALGQAEFDEVRWVLEQEPTALPCGSLAETWVAFCVLWTATQQFTPELLPMTFPGLVRERERVEALVTRGLALDAALAKEPHEAAPRTHPEVTHPPVEKPARAARVAAGRRSLARGNAVRALIRAARSRGAPGADELRAAALQQLVDRLERVSEGSGWREALEPLVANCHRGFRAPEGRILYDLQEVCEQAEGEVFAVSIVDWVRSMGRLKPYRPLPLRRAVRVVRGLARARSRFKTIRGPIEPLAPLDAMIRAVHAARSEVLRGELEDRAREAVEATIPCHGPVEEAARDAMCAALASRILGRGQVGFSQVRDVIATRAIGLPDLGLGDLVGGDKLLRLDRHLMLALDGVYRSGELYLRLFQRLSGLAFGTPPGRFLTRFIALPVGGAYLILEGSAHTIGVGIELVTHHHPHFVTPWSMVGLSAVLFALLHSPAVRQGALALTKGALRLLRSVVIDLPRAFFRLPLVLRIRQSRAYRALMVGIVRPALLALPVALVLELGGADSWVSASAMAVATLFLALFLQTSLGRAVWEEVADRSALVARSLTYRIVPAVLRWVLDAFRALMDRVDRALYTIDEWLRYRRGQRRSALWLKGVLGTAWFFVDYVVRFSVNLLIEPQINPIKHFPIVTVSHKLMLPMTPLVGGAVGTVLPVGPVMANSMGLAMVSATPGVFGFLAWELKENWKLFQANAPQTLRPVRIGSHGETLLRLLRPGFHSGTLPKGFRKLRAERRRADRTGDWRRVRKLMYELHHVEDDLAVFIDDALRILRGSPLGDVRRGPLSLGANRVVVTFTRGSGEPALLSLEHHSGLIVSKWLRGGWLQTLDGEERAVFRGWCLGLFAATGVTVVGEHVDAILPAGSHYDVADEGLVIWSAAYETQCTVPIIDGATRGPVPWADGETPFLPSISSAAWRAFWRDGTTIASTVRVLPPSTRQ